MTSHCTTSSAGPRDPGGPGGAGGPRGGGPAELTGETRSFGAVAGEANYTAYQARLRESEESLRFLAGHACVRPSPDSIAVAQDRRAEKRFLTRHGFPVAPYAVIDARGTASSRPGSSRSA